MAIPRRDFTANMNPVLNSESLEKELTKRSTPAFIPLILAGLFMVTGMCALIFVGREKARILGQSITDLDIQPLLNTETPITDADMQGKVVVIHFWGYWSPESAKELPGFAKTQSEYRKDGEVLFASISCNQHSNDTQDSLQFYTKKFLQDTDASDLPVYGDPAEFSRARISQLLTAGGFSYPTTLVIDSAGRVADVWRAAVPPSALKKAIEKAKLSNKVR